MIIRKTRGYIKKIVFLLRILILFSVMNEKFDFNAFLHRQKLKHREAAPIIGVSQSLVSSWASDRAVPSYDSMIRLIEAGMTADELFGKETAEKLMQNSNGKPSKNELKAVVREIMEEIKSES